MFAKRLFELRCSSVTQVRSLLKANDVLRKQIQKMQMENKDNIRVKMIKALKKQVEEQQVCVAFI